MRIKQNSTNKTLCLFLFALYCIFTNCKDPSVRQDNYDDDVYNYPNGTSKDLTFSHNSGLYNRQFSLRITAEAENEIYYSTDGSIPLPSKTGNGYVFKYSSPITVQNRNGQENVLASRANTEQMYMAPNDPRGSVPLPYYPSNNQVPKATVIRVIAVDSDGKKSGVVTKTYFIGDNLANYANNRVISLVSNPFNLVDVNYGIMVRGNPNNRWETKPSYNFNMKGADWEREAYLEIFEGDANNRSVSLSTGVGIRVKGGWSRAVGQKSFNVYFKEQYGINNLRNYNLIPGAVKADGKTPVERYKGFMLRNGGNECDYTKFYDVFIQDLLSDRSFSTQASVPCVVYLNGEYWGFYNLQEKYSDNHTEYKYGVKKENVITFDNYELDDGNEGEESLYWSMVGMANKDMSNSANYNAFCVVSDIDNFIDYFAAQIYVYNEDWPQNNFRIWRTRNVEPGNPYGDKKWRWQMFDTEFALGIYNSGGLTGQNRNMDTFAKILNGENKENQHNKLFKALLKNPDFCKKFVNTMMDLYNVNFHPDSYLPKLNNYAAVYKPLMDGYFERWGRPWNTVFQDKVDDAKRYLNNIRNAMVYNYLPKYFGGYSGIANIGISSSNLCDVTLSVIGVSGTTIKINTVTPNLASGTWTGKYYSGNPVTVTASPPTNGFQFDGWTVTGGIAASPSALTTVVALTGNSQITANYKLIQGADVPVTGISLNNTTLNLTTGGNSNLIATVMPTNATYKTVFWHSNNPNVASVDTNGKITAVKSGTAVITASTVEGIDATCTVNVAAVITSVAFSKTVYGFIYGETMKLDITILPVNAPNKQTTWSSSNPSVATVANDGTVTAKSTAGTTTITVTTNDGNKTAICTINVKAATVILDLSKILTGQSNGVISNWNAFNNLIGGNFGNVEYKIITENGVKKLQFIEYHGSCRGLDLRNDKIDFHVGDIIEIKGTFTKISNKCGGFVLQMNNWGWKPLGDWGYWSSGKFEKTFEPLTQEDVDNIKVNPETPGIRIRSCLAEGENWDQQFPGGIGKIILEQVKIYGYRE